MKKIIGSFLLALLALNGFAQGINDGPYAKYAGDSTKVMSVVSGKAVIQSFASDKKTQREIEVNFDGHSDWDFKVPLRLELKVEASEYVQPEKLFIVSDIEGEFEGFRRLLIANKVINEKYQWTFGRGHLVICGDLFDRGLSVPESIWLIYKLEDLARAAGGYVHTILGNHDIMNLSGDLRYVQQKYIESAKILGVDYLSLYGTDAELGRWLRTKNTIEKIGDNLCMHAGVSPIINSLGLSVADINRLCRPYYDKVKVLKGVGDAKIDPFFKGESSLFWYRGYFFDPKATEAEVSETLRVFGVQRIVAGHTIVPENIAFYYEGKVLGIDVNRHAGDHQAALFEGGKWYKVNDKGESKEL
ncbi:metallophosphoesterase [Sphingobacteriaceae bacterium GW460-11-11-14-LB5]|nr:metallophosphoesterase [Sphingobacteriaceae bacterium GW460-11-11-14-LB5]